MKKNLVSILITTFNKGRYLKKTIDSCLKQTFKNKEILVFDDCSTDDSLNILSKFNGIRVVKNKKKRFKSGPLNQIFGITHLLKMSKGKLIFLLDSDDLFKKNKLSVINKIFNKDKKINFLQDTPLSSFGKRKMTLKKKNYFFSIWPSFFPTSSIAVRRDFLLTFLKFLNKNKHPNLEIDARLSIYAFLLKEFIISEKNLTIYNYDEFGISSKYKKYSKYWWKKRNDAFNYLIYLQKKFGISFKKGPDYYFTKIINSYF